MDDDQLLAFQSTPLMRGETVKNEELKDKMSISIHSPHARGDEELLDFIMRDCNFNPLPSCEGRRRVVYATSYTSIFQSTPLMRGETKSSLTLSCAIAISIHSPHARGDAVSYTPRHTPPYFNPLPSCEGRQAVCSFFAWFRLFQSTPLMRGETHWRKLANLSQRFQSTPLMRGETWTRGKILSVPVNFNPLPSCEGRL